MSCGGNLRGSGIAADGARSRLRAGRGTGGGGIDLGGVFVACGGGIIAGIGICAYGASVRGVAGRGTRRSGDNGRIAVIRLWDRLGVAVGAITAGVGFDTCGRAGGGGGDLRGIGMPGGGNFIDRVGRTTGAASMRSVAGRSAGGGGDYSGIGGGMRICYRVFKLLKAATGTLIQITAIRAAGGGYCFDKFEGMLKGGGGKIRSVRIH